MGSVDSVAADIKEHILEKFPLARKRGLTEQTPLLDSGIIDSMGVLDIVGYLENTFQIAVTDEELTPENFRNIVSLSSFITSKRAATVPTANR